MSQERRKNDDRRGGIQMDLPEDDRKKERRKRERRTKERIAVRMWVRNIEGDANYFQQTGNLSVSGMYILSPTPQKPGNIIDLEFLVPGTDHLINCQSQVVNSKQDGEFYGLSVRFINMEPKDKRVIESAMDELISEYWFLTE